MRKFREFEEAREFVRSLNIKGQTEWHEYSKSGKRPHNIPSNPNIAYKGKGWKGWGDFLGTGNIASFDREFLSFEQAREFVRSLGIKGQIEWKEYSKSGKRPHDIPSSPNETYKGKGWKGYGDWLGTGRTKNHTNPYLFLPYEEARKFVRSLKLKGVKEWQEYRKSCKRPYDIPSSPHQVYKSKGWRGYGDWLGTGNIAPFDREFLSFEQARKFVRSLKLKKLEEWKEYSKSGKRPHDIPSNPNIAYKGKGWKGYGDWLGTGNIASFDREFFSFEEARKFVRSLKLKNQTEWQEYSKSGKRPHDIPSNPNEIYKGKGWKGWGDFLGTGNISTLDREFLPYEQARKFVRSLNIKGQTEWKEYSKSGKRPHDIPGNPHQVYKGKGWKGLGDWLGNDKKNYTLTKKEVQVVKEITEKKSVSSKIKSLFSRLDFSK